jgi:hypothetical protein
MVRHLWRPETAWFGVIAEPGILWEKQFVVKQVDVRINNVDAEEIYSLNSVKTFAMNPQYSERIVDQNEGRNDFVIRVKPGNLEGLKNALRNILQIVRPDRINIEP